MAQAPSTVTGTVVLNLTCPRCEAREAYLRFTLPLHATPGETGGNTVAVKLRTGQPIRLAIFCANGACRRSVDFGDVPLVITEAEDFEGISDAVREAIAEIQTPPGTVGHTDGLTDEMGG